MGQKLGQHFLKNPDKIREIVDCLAIKPEETIIEIGPGRGALTLPLLTAITSQKGAKLIAIEKDLALAAILQKKIGPNPQFTLIEGDIRIVLPILIKKYQLKSKNYKLVGNIPYYLTGYLLRQISELPTKPGKTVLTIQKEVAERVAAVPPRMNLLAASVQFWAEPKIVGRIGRQEFQPAPKVDSAIIQLIPLKTEETPIKAAAYYEIIKKIFSQPRKTLKNNLRAGWPNATVGLFETLEKVGIKTDNRPQDLALKQLKQITEMLYNYQ